VEQFLWANIDSNTGSSRGLRAVAVVANMVAVAEASSQFCRVSPGCPNRFDCAGIRLF
jgi:hypothetical protein